MTDEMMNLGAFVEKMRISLRVIRRGVSTPIGAIRL